MMNSYKDAAIADKNKKIFQYYSRSTHKSIIALSDELLAKLKIISITTLAKLLFTIFIALPCFVCIFLKKFVYSLYFFSTEKNTQVSNFKRLHPHRGILF